MARKRTLYTKQYGHYMSIGQGDRKLARFIRKTMKRRVKIKKKGKLVNYG